jgi:hypothetical protein
MLDSGLQPRHSSGSDPGADAAGGGAAIEFYQDWSTRRFHVFGVNGSVLKSHCTQYLFPAACHISTRSCPNEGEGRLPLQALLNSCPGNPLQPGQQSTGCKEGVARVGSW